MKPWKAGNMGWRGDEGALIEGLVRLGERVKQLRDLADLVVTDVNQMLGRLEVGVLPDAPHRLRATRKADHEELRSALERVGADRSQAVVDSNWRSDRPRSPSSPLVPRDFAMTTRCQEDDLATLLDQTSDDEINPFVAGADTRSADFLPIAPQECVMMINEMRGGRPVTDHDSPDLDDPRAAAEIHTVHLGSSPLPALEVIRAKPAVGPKVVEAPLPSRPISTPTGTAPSSPPRAKEGSIAPECKKGEKRPTTRRKAGSGRKGETKSHERSGERPAKRKPTNPDRSPERIEDLLSSYLDDK
jgi:hypothetical protein